MNIFNKLSPAELERLALLSEELCEVGQVIGKILRHGYESHNPFDRTKTTNRKLLEKELGDVTCAISLLTISADISRNSIKEFASIKLVSVQEYLHHQKDASGGAK